MRQLKIAITGGIGSGKSLVAKILRGWNYPVFSCDEIYKEVIRSSEYISQIKAIFPTVVDGSTIDRGALSEIVFKDEEKRKQLNEIAHPLIMQRLFQYMSKIEGGIVFAEVPLLFECNFENLFDKIIYVFREKHLRIEGVVQRDGLSVDSVEKRIQAQFDFDSKEGKKRLSKNKVFILENNASIKELEDKVLSLLGNM